MIADSAPHVEVQEPKKLTRRSCNQKAFPGALVEAVSSLLPARVRSFFCPVHSVHNVHNAHFVHLLLNLLPLDRRPKP